MPARHARAAWRVKQAIAVRRATRLFTVSEAARADLGLPQAAVVREAPAAAFTPRPDEEIAAARARVGVEGDGPVIVYAAGGSRHKHPETLVAAMAHVEGATAVMTGDLGDAVRASDRVLLPGSSTTTRSRRCSAARPRRSSPRTARASACPPSRPRRAARHRC